MIYSGQLQLPESAIKHRSFRT